MTRDLKVALVGKRPRKQFSPQRGLGQCHVQVWSVRQEEDGPFPGQSQGPQRTQAWGSLAQDGVPGGPLTLLWGGGFWPPVFLPPQGCCCCRPVPVPRGWVAGLPAHEWLGRGEPHLALVLGQPPETLGRDWMGPGQLLAGAGGCGGGVGS